MTISYSENQIELRGYLRGLRSCYKAQMLETPGLFIGLPTDDLDHWAQYEVYSIDDYVFYNDYVGLYDVLSEMTSKSYARMKLRDCKTISDLDQVWKEWKDK